MSEEIAISVSNVSKDFVLPHEKVNSIKSLFTTVGKKTTKKKLNSTETQHALKDITFAIKKGEFFGIVGRNGSGKSTLLKILAGIYQPTSGEVSTIGKIVPFIELGVGFNAELTGRENVYLNGAMIGFSQKEVDSMYDDIVSFAELERFMDQKLKNYSSGMQVRLAFSLAIRADADILLVDEVLAVGDADFQRKCFKYFQDLKKRKKTVVFVSHDMGAVREYCDRAILIEKSRLVESGDTNKVATAYTRMFSEQAEKVKHTAQERTKRWGDDSVHINSALIQKSKDLKSISIMINAIANKDMTDPVIGFIVKNAANNQLFGTNNKIKQKNIGQLIKGQTLEVQWDIPNVFNDGSYTVDVAISYSDAIQACDWWEDAVTFSIFKEDRTPYMFNPSVELIVKKSSA